MVTARTQLTVREMQLSEVSTRINYFHDAADERLARSMIFVY